MGFTCTRIYVGCRLGKHSREPTQVGGGGGRGWWYLPAESCCRRVCAPSRREQTGTPLNAKWFQAPASTSKVGPTLLRPSHAGLLLFFGSTHTVALVLQCGQATPLPTSWVYFWNSLTPYLLLWCYFWNSLIPAFQGSQPRTYPDTA